ncbi:MAG: hypothetical protein ACREJ9_07250 [Candidatus Rokuibacteriota bacterium]
MTRRELLERAAVVVAAAVSLGHTPYRQWQVYRQSRLIIVTGAEDEQAFAVAEALAALLARHLPDSRATVARARDTVEAVNLVASRQLDVLLIAAREARGAAAGQGRFANTGPVPLRTLALVGDWALVCRDDFPVERAYRVARALSERRAELPRPASATPATTPAAAPVPLHPGALDYHQASPPRP